MVESQNSYIEGNLGKAAVTSVISGGRRKLHYTFQGEIEKVEEYDMKTHELLVRKWKIPSKVKESKWDYEIGDEPKKQDMSEQTLLQSCKNPIFVRKDTQEHFQFRIRNLTFPEDVYQVEIDTEKQQLVVKTTNKKYYKRIDVPDLKRLNEKLIKESLFWYKKPDSVKRVESDLRNVFEKLNKKNPKEGDIECAQQ